MINFELAAGEKSQQDVTKRLLEKHNQVNEVARLQQQDYLE